MTDFDRHAKSYSKTIEDSITSFGKSHDFFVRCKAEILLRILAETRDPKTAKLLDVGCGTGLIHPYLSDHVAEICGVDVSQESLELAKHSAENASYSHYDGQNLPYGNDIFDCTYAICVLHHVPVVQWPAFVKEMVRTLKPDGLFAIIEHNPLNPATQWVVRNCDLDEGAVLLWPRQLERICTDAGLKHVTTDYIQFTPFEGSFFRRLDGWLAPVPLGTQYVTFGRK